MPSTFDQATTLREIRKTRGMTAQAVADQVAAILGEPGRHGESIANIERRGTQNYHVISALAQVYGLKPEEIAAVASPASVQNK